MGDRAEAQKNLAAAKALYDGIPIVEPEDSYNRACLAALGAALSVPAQGEPTAEQLAEHDALVDQAIKLLKQAVSGGFRKLHQIRRDPDLAPLARTF